MLLDDLEMNVIKSVLLYLAIPMAVRHSIMGIRIINAIFAVSVQSMSVHQRVT